MKFLITLFVALMSAQVFASEGIKNSSLTTNHQNKIEEAILKSCANLYKYSLTQLSYEVVYDRVDTGITDEYYTTTLEVSSRLDQITDEYVITVQSVIADGYDHESKDWGLISVLSVDGCLFPVK